MNAGPTLKNFKGMMYESCSFPPKNMPEHAIFLQNNLIKHNFYDHESII